MKEAADVTRVTREIKILKRNIHPNVIQLYEVLDSSTAIYLIMEHIDGGELFDYIVSHQRLQEPQACFFFHQICDGLEYLHRMEVTHRDLKPENLLLQSSPKGWLIKIVDFGLSNTHDGGRLLAKPAEVHHGEALPEDPGGRLQGPQLHLQGSARADPRGADHGPQAAVLRDRLPAAPLVQHHRHAREQHHPAQHLAAGGLAPGRGRA
eukprot:CAMPEP_0194602298 /NCGR_PEP_ID=MMETSP0292-20121207/29562_1 /TAXON_ID=39354 /ORGANISM="Heterosigma akashiwo, Strain CCMP2393" /LENGTH=207 /DNA_ID=CAMNT_0039464505 /DNA_START=1 /DNA_END=622 /DNA_ORIENTATION=+